MAKKKKFYAIREVVSSSGEKLAENLVLTTWAETEKLVKGNKADYKSFFTEEEAFGFLSESDPLMHKSDGLYNSKSLHCYVDGSFNSEIPNYSYGLVCVKNEKVLHVDKQAGKNKEAVRMQQIAGELLGAMKAVLYAHKQGEKEVVIFHDYLGVCYHATGYWKRDNAFGETYYQWMQQFFNEHPELNVIFCKVDAHTGDDFNELADGFAKLGVGLTPAPVFYRLCEKHGLHTPQTT